MSVTIDEQKRDVLNYVFVDEEYTWSAFEIVCASKMERLALDILSKKDVVISPECLSHAFLWCCKHGLLRVANAILDAVSLGNMNMDLDFGYKNRKCLKHFSKMRSPLIHACKNGMTGVIVRLLGMGMEMESEICDINYVDDEGMNALLMATKNGLSYASMMILGMGLPKLNVNYKGPNGMTALIWACVNGLIPVCMALLDVEGIDVNVQDMQNNTPLLLSLSLSQSHPLDLECVALKILQNFRRVININHSNNEQETALLLGCRNGLSFAATEILKVPGLKKTKIEFKPRTEKLLVLACAKGMPHIALRILALRIGDVNNPDHTGTTALIAACMGGGTIMSHVAQQIIHNNDHVNLKHISDEGNTALIQACKHKMTNVIHSLLFYMRDTKKTGVPSWNSANLATNHKDGMGMSALDWCCYHNMPKYAYKILDRILCIDNDPLNEYNHTPNEEYALLWSCRNNIPEVALILARLPTTKPNLTDETDSSPLLWAAKHNMIEVINALLIHPLIDLNKSTKLNKFNESSIIYTIQYNQEDLSIKLIDSLYNHDHSLSHSLSLSLSLSLTQACHNNLEKVALHILNKYPDSIDLTTRDEKTSTALIWAIKNDMTQIISLLLSHPQLPNFINLTNNLDESPFLIACQKQNPNLSYLLIAKYADILDLSVHTTNSPLITACSNPTQTSTALKMLRTIQTKISHIINYTNQKNETALMIACANSYTDIINQLLIFPNLDTSLTNKFGDTALLILTIPTPIPIILNDQNISTITKLINHPTTNLNHQNNDGHTILSHLCSFMHPHHNNKFTHLILSIINHKSTIVDTKDLTGSTPLILAIINFGFDFSFNFSSDFSSDFSFDFNSNFNSNFVNDSLSIIKALIKKSPNLINETNNNNESPLTLASTLASTSACPRNNNNDLAHYLLTLPTININQITNNKKTPLINSIESENTQLALKILDMPNIQINHQDDTLSTALILACKHNLPDVASKLLDMPDIQIHHRDKRGINAFMHACNRGEKLEDIALRMIS